jgi:hypothetical protein
MSSLDAEAPGGAVASGIYWDLVHEQLADAITRGGGLGLGAALQSSFGVPGGPGQGSETTAQPVQDPSLEIKPHLREATPPATLPPVWPRSFAAAGGAADLPGPITGSGTTGTTHP